MTHDPLCPNKGYKHALPMTVSGGKVWRRECCCDIIARVRADEREQAGMRVRSMRGASEGVLRVAAAMAAGDVDAGVGW
jgi:hypothetical protein